MAVVILGPCHRPKHLAFGGNAKQRRVRRRFDQRCEQAEKLYMRAIFETTTTKFMSNVYETR